MNRIICLDIDDTLIDTDYKFEITFCDCIKAIIVAFETRSPQIDEILATAREIDNHKLATYPIETRYKPVRLLDTWYETYQQLCKKYGTTPKPHVELMIQGIIGQNFDAPWYIIPGALETLEELLEMNGFELHALTTGDHQIQVSKLESTHLLSYFKYVEVCYGEKRNYLGKLAKKFGAENICMVGNSLKSDVNAALDSKVKAIHIPRGNWHHHAENPVNESFIRLDDIRELPEAIERIWPSA